MKIICETTKRHGQGGGKQDELKQNHKCQLISKGLFGVFNSSKKWQTKPKKVELFLFAFWKNCGC